MWVAYSEIWRYKHQAPFIPPAQQNISLFYLFANFSTTKSSGLSGSVMHATPSSQTSFSVNSLVSWVVKPESDESETVLYGSVPHVLTLFLRL